MNPVNPAKVGLPSIQTSPATPPGTATEIAGLIIADHKRILRLFRALDDVARLGEPALTRSALSQIWARLTSLLDLHSRAEEQICHPALLGRDRRTTVMLKAAVADHNDICAAVGEAKLLDVGSVGWWRAVSAAQQATADHFSREESGLLAEVCGYLQPESDATLAQQWTSFVAAHVGSPQQ